MTVVNSPIAIITLSQLTLPFSVLEIMMYDR